MNTKLTDKLRYVLLIGPKITGQYDPVDILPHIEEGLTGDEVVTVVAFLEWVHGGGRRYGYDTLDFLWAHWLANH